MAVIATGIPVVVAPTAVQVLWLVAGVFIGSRILWRRRRGEDPDDRTTPS